MAMFFGLAVIIFAAVVSDSMKCQ